MTWIKIDEGMELIESRNIKNAPIIINIYYYIVFRIFTLALFIHIVQRNVSPDEILRAWRAGKKPTIIYAISMLNVAALRPPIYLEVGVADVYPDVTFAPPYNLSVNFISPDV